MTAPRKAKHTFALLAFTTTVGVLASAPLGAASYYWDANGEEPGTGSAGVWDTTSALWRNGSASGTLEVWPNTDPGNADHAVITGTAGNITLDSDSQDIHFNKLTLDSGSVLAPESGTARLHLSGANPTIEVPDWKTHSVHPVICGNSLTKTSGGQLALYGDNTHTGGTYLKAGSIAIGHVNALGTGTFHIQGGWSLTVISGTDMPVTNAVVMDADLTFNNNNFPGWGAPLTLAGPTLLTGSRQVSVQILGVTFDGVIADGGNSHALTYASGNYNNFLTLGAENTFSGGFTYNGTANGTFNIRHMGALGTGTFTINGSNGRIDNASGADGTISTHNAQRWNAGAFTFAGSHSLDTGTNTVTLGADVTVDVAAKTLTVGGPLVQADGTPRGLRKTGAGTLALAGAGAYAGGTAVAAGVLSAEPGGTLGTGPVSVDPPGRLVLRHGDAIADDAVVTLNRAEDACGKMEIAAGVVERVGSVILDGVVHDAPGTSFGATGSGANVQSDDFFLGTGILRITAPTSTIVTIR